MNKYMIAILLLKSKKSACAGGTLFPGLNALSMRICFDYIILYTAGY